MTNPRKKPQATANEIAVRAAYVKNAESITSMLDQLGRRLQTHKTQFNGLLRDGRVNWGFVGDLAHVAEMLTEITEFLGKE